MNLPRRAAALAVCVAVGAGCSPVVPAPSPTPDASAPASSAARPAELDLTAPGAATDLVQRLLDASGSRRALMVTVTRRDASVAVLKDGSAQTWAWRDGRIQQVPTDIAYVAQREFTPSDFDFHDLGALFRAGAAVSGSDRDQRLQIVDYSAGLVTMSVSTNPESRAVFLNPDGSLLPTLDFTSAWGLERGYADVVGPRGTASQLGFGSQLGTYLDSPHSAQGEFTRRQRSARTPVIVTPRSSNERLPAFDPATVRPSVVWGVLEQLREQGRFALDTPWSCVADDRAATGTARLYFTVGDRSFVTDLSGRPLP